MAIGDSVLTSLYDNVSKLVNAQIATNVTATSTAILPLILAAILAYCVYIAWQIVTAQNEMFITDILKNMVMIVLVGAVCYTSKYYQTYVIPFVLNSGDDLSSALFGSYSVSTTMLDEFMASINMSLERMQEKMNFGFTDNWGLSMQAVFYWILLWITSGIFSLFATAYLLVAKLMVAILMSVGPIFICLAIFPVTRSMFTSWCSQCANYILLTLGYCIVLKLFISFITEQFETETLNFKGIYQIVIVMYIGVYILGQVGMLISSLTGGVGINSLNGNINSMLSRVGGGARSVGGKGAKVAKKLASNVISKIKGSGGIGG